MKKWIAVLTAMLLLALVGGFALAEGELSVLVNGEDDEATPIPKGTIMKEAPDGTYVVMEEAEILTGTAGLPGSRLVIVADSTGETGTTTTVTGANGAETVKTARSILVGMMGEVDQGQLIVGDKTWDDLTDTQKKNLRLQMEVWNFNLVHVTQG